MNSSYHSIKNSFVTLNLYRIFILFNVYHMLIIYHITNFPVVRMTHLLWDISFVKVNVRQILPGLSQAPNSFVYSSIK